MALRYWPIFATNPTVTTGKALAALQKTEGDAIWARVVTQVGSIGGTADNITGVCDPPLTVDPADGQTFRFTPTANNTSATVNVNLDGRGNILLKDCEGNALAADDLVASRNYTFYRQGAAGPYRLTHPTQRALIAALAAEIAAANTGWEQINDTTIPGSTAYVEHTFTAGAYSKILVIASGMSGAPGSSASPSVTLRNAAGAIVTISATTGITDAVQNWTADAEFTIDLVSATKLHFGRVNGVDSGGGAMWTEVTGVGSSATAPDRIRVAHTSGNLDAGRVMSYGLKV